MSQQQPAFPTPLAADVTSQFIAEQVARTATATKAKAQKENLASAIAEVELQTQIEGASFIKVHCIDPEWVLQTSGLITVDEGLLNEVEVEFPKGSNWKWRLCAVEGTTEPGQPNLVLTFEDYIINELRQHRGEKTAKTTRAKFIKALVDEVGLSGKLPKIRFVCPGLNNPELTSAYTTSTSGATAAETAIAKANKETRANKSPGPITRGSWAESVLAAGGWPVSSENVKALVGWAVEEGGAGPQFGVPGNQANYNPLNTTQPEPGAGNQAGGQGNIKSYVSWAQGVEATVTTLKNGNYGNIVAALTKGTSATEVAEAIVHSPWGTTSGVLGTIAAASSGVEGGQRVSASGTGEAAGAVGQLKRGSTQNPSEDSWETITRLAKEVRWFAFTADDKHGNNILYYMDGPQLAAQEPVLYLDVPKNHVERVASNKSRVSEYGVIRQGLQYTFDNTTFEYQATHKVKGRVVKKSSIAKPATPSEVRLQLVCGPTEYRAGDVFVFKNSGPINGRWIVSDATRNCLKDVFTQFILEPPLAPTAAASEGAASTATPGTLGAAAAIAEKALAENKGGSNPFRYVYGGGRGSTNSAGAPVALFGAAPREFDCSSFTEYCYKEAGLPDPSGLNYSPIGTTETMIHNSTKVATPEPGDLCLFGETGHTTHVTIYVGGGEAISMGGEGDPRRGPAATTGPSGFLGYYRPNNA